MVKLVIIADDLTGALDTGVQFAKCGSSVKVITADRLEGFSFSDAGADVLAIANETRHISADEAYSLTFSVVGKIIANNVSHIYIKTDSGLRGNIGCVLHAALNASGEKFLPFVPAFPDMRRITKDGVHFIDDVPIDKSVFGKDPFEPVRSPYVKDLFKGVDAWLESFQVSGTYITDFTRPTIGIFDAQTNRDMRKIAEHLNEKRQLRLAAGCAGFASVLPELVGLPKRQVAMPRIGKRLLVFCGSLSPITRRQIEYGEKIGYGRLVLSPRQMTDGYFELEEGKKWIDSHASLFSGGNEVMVDTGVSDPGTLRQAIEAGSSEKITLGLKPVKILGSMIGRILEAGYAREHAVMIIGGDTMLGFLQQVPWREITPVCEVELGTVLSSISINGDDIWVISKSGGFGGDDLLERISLKITG